MAVILKVMDLKNLKFVYFFILIKLIPLRICYRSNRFKKYIFR